VDTKLILTVYASAANSIFPDYFWPDCCLNASRVAIDALREFKVTAKQVSVYALFVNKEWWAKFQEHSPVSLANFTQWKEDPKAWSVGVDTSYPQTKHNWPGHLVVVTQRYLIDSAAAQYDRPQHGINLPWVLLTDLVPGFLTGRNPIVTELSEKARGIYSARPDDKSYLLTAGFSRHDRNVKVTKAVVERMKRLLGKLPLK
jgi:hypothetical protein